MQTFAIDRKLSGRIKGVAILMMLIHHIFTFPGWIVAGHYEPARWFVSLANGPSKLCVALFAFITGWAFCLAADKSLKSSAKRVLRFYKMYWLCTVLCMAVAVGCGWRPGLPALVSELTGWHPELMKFCWYVFFYLLVMLILPLTAGISDKGLLWGFVCLTAAPAGAFLVLSRVSVGGYAWNNLLHLLQYFPCVEMGYLCCRYDLFGRARRALSRVPDWVLAPVCILAACVGKRLVASQDWLYGTLLVFGLACALRHTATAVGKGLAWVLEKLGALSTWLWFLHCLFFADATRGLLQPVLYWSANPVLVFAAAMVLLIPAACAVEALSRALRLSGGKK